jgi:hypothetical protein
MVLDPAGSFTMGYPDLLSEGVPVGGLDMVAVQQVL